MVPNVSTIDERGCAWICLDPDCPELAATELTASSSVFTTHTPVPAGNDRFPPELMQKYFEGYAGTVEIRVVK